MERIGFSKVKEPSEKWFGRCGACGGIFTAVEPELNWKHNSDPTARGAVCPCQKGRMSTSKAIIWFRPESECPHELIHHAESSPEEPTLIERIKAIEMKLDQVIEMQKLPGRIALEQIAQSI